MASLSLMILKIKPVVFKIKWQRKTPVMTKPCTTMLTIFEHLNMGCLQLLARALA